MGESTFIFQPRYRKRCALSGIYAETIGGRRSLFRDCAAHDSATSPGRHVHRALRSQGLGDAEIDFIERVAKQVAVAVDNALNFEAAQAYQAQLARERDRLQVLLDINNLLVSTRDTSALFRGIVSSLKPVLRHDYTSLALWMTLLDS